MGKVEKKIMGKGLKGSVEGVMKVGCRKGKEREGNDRRSGARGVDAWRRGSKGLMPEGEGVEKRMENPGRASRRKTKKRKEVSKKKFKSP